MSETLLSSHGIVVLAFGIGALALWRGWDRRKRNPRRLPLPPGPKGVPILGNALQIAQGKSWETYRDWAATFGDIVYLEAIGQPMLVLSSLKVINDLLEKRAGNFSDRASTPALDMLKVEWAFGLADYGPYWKENRRMFHQYYNPGQLGNYHPVYEQQAKEFLQRLATNPSDFMATAKHFVGAVVMQISYGISDSSYTSKLIDDAEALVEGFTEVAIPGRFLVDTLPLLRFVPSWFPGAEWKRKLQAYGARNKEVYDRTFEDAMERAKRGIQGYHANVADDVIPKLPNVDDPSYPVMRKNASNATFVGYVSGVDTGTQAAQALFLALAMYPEVQKRAQEELERVIGACRLPKPSEVLAIPYLVALMKELTRWHSVAPLNIPRKVREDEEYNGYFIPKGTIVFCNSWAIMHDPDVFEDPMEFRPERYLKDGQLDPSVLDPEAAAFGYGRRICPGRYLSNESLTFMAASLLSVFDVRPIKDENGDPIPLEFDIGDELICKVKPFKVEITARSPEHAALISEY
ncbi:cytochrome P450 98A3 [Coprinopsis sp. MPI-PUGE-AT-0042]|nr:cytochrome P450 98A3 [Coprinopsis sp. MPI-PUGE-AT-0042]